MRKNVLRSHNRLGLSCMLSTELQRVDHRAVLVQVSICLSGKKSRWHQSCRFLSHYASPMVASDYCTAEDEPADAFSTSYLTSVVPAPQWEEKLAEASPNCHLTFSLSFTSPAFSFCLSARKETSHSCCCVMKQLNY